MGGYSYQDLATRLSVVEDKLRFVMTALRMKGRISNGLVGPDGQTLDQIADHSLAEWYLLFKQQTLEIAKAEQNG